MKFIEKTIGVLLFVVNILFLLILFTGKLDAQVTVSKDLNTVRVVSIKDTTEHFDVRITAEEAYQFMLMLDDKLFELELQLSVVPNLSFEPKVIIKKIFNCARYINNGTRWQLEHVDQSISYTYAKKLNERLHYIFNVDLR